jgi:hypothetical protein
VAPTNASHLNRIEAQFTALRYFTLDGTDHSSHAEQASMIRRYIDWRNRNANDKRLKAIINRANVADAALACRLDRSADSRSSHPASWTDSLPRQDALSDAHHHQPRQTATSGPGRRSLDGSFGDLDKVPRHGSAVERLHFGGVVGWVDGDGRDKAVEAQG